MKIKKEAEEKREVTEGKMRASINEIKNEAKTLKDQNSNYERSEELLTDKIKEIERECNQLKRDIENIEGKTQKKNKPENDETEKRENTDDQSKVAKGDIEEKTKEIRQLKKHIKELKTENEDKCSKIEELTKDNLMLKAVVQEYCEKGPQNEIKENPQISQSKQEYQNVEKKIEGERNHDHQKIQRICKYAMQGECRYGERCRYIHPQMQSARNTWNKNSMICRKFNNDMCNRPDCRYLHIRKNNEECRNFHGKGCKFGEYCKYNHTYKHRYEQATCRPTNYRKENNKERYIRGEGDSRNEIIQMQNAISDVILQIKDIKSSLILPNSDSVMTTNNNQHYVPQHNNQTNPMYYQQMDNCMNVSNVPNNNNYWCEQNNRATPVPPQIPGY